MKWKLTTATKHHSQCHSSPVITVKEEVALEPSQHVLEELLYHWQEELYGPRPTAKRIGRELLVQGAPELIEVATKRKSAKKALKSTVAKTARKQFGGSLHSRTTRGRQVTKRRRQQYAKPRTYKKRSTKKIISRKPQPRRSRLDFFSRVKNAN